MGWHHAYFSYEMRRYAVAKRKGDSRPTADNSLQAYSIE